MNRKQALQKACFLLREQAKEENLARFLLMYLLDENVATFNNNIDEDLELQLTEKYFALLAEHIKNDTPLSHLVGFDYFYDRKFKVTKDVLSPRMETEELVYKVIDYVEKNKLRNIKILDLCTGSGIIAITLAKELAEYSIEVFASDISEKALAVAKENTQNQLANVKFMQSDIFENITEQFDIIVSNPPYIAETDKVTMEKNVLAYDPHLALFADENGLYFYRKILEQAQSYLAPAGVIFFEIGYDQRESLQLLAQQNNLAAEVFKDINGRDRMVFIRRT